jgi:hypothetical protein
MKTRTHTVHLEKGEQINEKESNLKEGKIVINQPISTLHDVIKVLIADNNDFGYYIESDGRFVCKAMNPLRINISNDSIKAITTKQTDINKVAIYTILINVARFVNGNDWHAEIGNTGWIFYLYYNHGSPILRYNTHTVTKNLTVYFKSKDAMMEAVNIIGEDTLIEYLKLL